MTAIKQTSASEMPDEPVKRYFLLLFQDGNVARDDALSVLGRTLFREVSAQLECVVTSPKEQTEIDVWLESPGGDAHIAYKLFLELHHRSRMVRIVIPDFAKSAATLLAIGASEIWMGPSAELGPLDAQIEHPDREGVTVSALDVSNALGFLADTALNYLIVGGGRVVRSTLLPRVSVLERFAEFSAAFFRPVMEKLDPHLIHQAAKELEVAQRYARIMLQSAELSRSECRRLAGRLVEGYPSHGFVICRHEAGSLGLPVQKAELYDYWSLVKTLFAAFESGKFYRKLEGREENHLVRVVALTELEDLVNKNAVRPDTEGEAEENEEQDDEGTSNITAQPNTEDDSNDSR